MAAQSLIKRGKRTVAQHIKNEFSRSDDQRHLLNDLLDYLLDPLKSIDDFERLDWCRALIAGDFATFDDFSKTVSSYDNATTCGLVWTADFVAYRCRTCGLSACMSLCADCFHAGNHSGHDFNMFRSQAGGACDCGDVCVMKASGFCPRHGPDRVKSNINIPQDLLRVAEAMMPRLVFRLVQHMRDHCKPDMLDTISESMKYADEYLSFLHSLSDMGAAMKTVITRAVTSPSLYRNLTECTENSSIYQQRSQENYVTALSTLECSLTPEEFAGICCLEEPLTHTTLLEELLFWTIKFEFPQKVVTLLLSNLPDDDYKEPFTRAFTKHYSRICMALVSCHEKSHISNCVVHISVQLLSPEKLACKMVDEHNLLYVMLGSLKHMMEQALTWTASPKAKMVDCSKGVLKEHCYWPIVSDLINILSHKPVAHKFMADQKLLQFWFQLLAYFQGMNPNSRELSQHVEYEPDTYYSAFSAELEICSSPMWSMLVHCKDKNNDVYTKAVLSSVLVALHTWLEAVSITPHSKLHQYRVSFHYPLHRYFSVFLSNAVRQQHLSLARLLPPESMLQRMMLHPLQLQVVSYEVAAGLWVRNGLQIRGQAMTYVQYHFCSSMVDADIFLLQICASRLDSDFFLKTVLERFHLLDVLSFAPRQQYGRHFLKQDQEMPMLEGALTFLAMLLSVQTQLGMTERELARMEMITLLCMADRTHSQLMDMMPEKCGFTEPGKDFESILEEVGDYKAPNFEAGGGMMQQGMYVPKAFIWEKDYDPIYVLLRAMYRQDFQSSVDRYTTYVRQRGLYKGSGSPWPPFRLPGPLHPAYNMLRKILHCRTLHGVLFTLLHKAVNERQTSDTVVYLAIHLLEMAVKLPAPVNTGKETPVPTLPRDQQFSEWFPSNCIFKNLTHVVKEVAVTVQELGRERSYPLSPQTFGSAGSSSAQVVSASSLSSQAHASLSALLSFSNIAPTEMVNAVHAMLEEAAFPSEESMELEPETSAGQATCSQAVSTSSDLHTRTEHKGLHESMLMLLLKLHGKLSGKTNSYVPESVRGPATEAERDSRIGDGVFFVGKVLDEICRRSPECCALVEGTYRAALPPETAASPRAKQNRKKEALDQEQKRRRAQERQKKLMAEFASKQKEFMKKVLGEGSGEDAGETAAAENVIEEKTYDCVICNQTAPSTNERPFGLVALLQSTSVLGHRGHTTEPRMLHVVDGSFPNRDNCGAEHRHQWEALAQEFDKGSCLMSVNIGWEGGTHAQTCGHYVHLDCHMSYTLSLQSQPHHSLDISAGEYSCPLCRQLSNSAIPILPDEGPALSMPAPRGDREHLKLIAETMLRRQVSLNSKTLTRAVATAMDNLTSATYDHFKIREDRPEAMHIYVCSILRTNLELELLQTGGSPCLRPTTLLARKTSCILPLLHVLNIHSKLLTTRPYTQLWSHVTGYSVEAESTRCMTVYEKGVPILLKDVMALLIQFVLDMPTTIHKAIYQCFVQALFNVLYVQALAVTSCSFSTEERLAWRQRNSESETNTSLPGLLSQVIGWLEAGGHYAEPTSSESLLAICQSIWCPQSVESSVQQFCLPYLRVAALLQHSWYGETLPVMALPDSVEEFRLLTRYLGLWPDPDEGGMAPEMVNSATCVHWYCEEPGKLIQAWCQHFTQSVETSSSPASIRSLLCINPMWSLPCLVTLPQEYDKIFQFYRKRECRSCGQTPREPSLCLVCGCLLCFKDACCLNSQTNLFECVQHSITCGGGTGIFLIVNSSLTVVIRGQRATLWGSLYLDAHGEEDKDLKRGKPLFLSLERYHMLQEQWVTHSLDRTCKRWGFHQGRL